MTTGNEHVNIEQTKLMGYQDFGTYFFEYTRNLIHNSLSTVWSEDAVFISALGMSGDGANSFEITGDSLSTDGAGKLLKISDSSVKSGIKFQNTSSIQYYVGLHATKIPVGIVVNPRTGLPNYLKWKEEIGEEASPDDVTDNGDGTITFKVDSVTESGVTNAGRQVVVYKVIADKNATTEEVAIETCIVTWSGTSNEITTTGSLGQSSISETASDYKVVCVGPTVLRNTDLRIVDEYTFVGIITGNGATPTTFNTTDQNVADFDLSTVIEQINSVEPKATQTPLTSNTAISIGTASSRITDLAFCKIDGVEKILALDFAVAEQLIVVDKTSFMVDGTESLSGLPTGDWYPYTIVSDDYYCYIIFTNLGVTNDIRMQSYSLDDFSPNTNWPSTGIEISEGGWVKVTRLIWASNYLACTGVNTEVLSLIDPSDGTILDTGVGDMPAGGYINDLCSDGENIYFCDDNGVYSATIADLSVGCGGSNWPQDVGGGNRIACASDGIIVCAGAGNPLVVVCHKDNADIGSIGADGTVCEELWEVLCDGVGFLALGRRRISTNPIQCAFRLPVFSLSPHYGGMENLVATRHDIIPITYQLITTYSMQGLSIHDGKDWYITSYYSSGSDANQYIFRLPLTRWR